MYLQLIYSELVHAEKYARSAINHTHALGIY